MRFKRACTSSVVAGKFQRFAHKPPLVVFAEVGNIGFKQG